MTYSQETRMVVACDIRTIRRDIDDTGTISAAVAASAKNAWQWLHFRTRSLVL